MDRDKQRLEYLRQQRASRNWEEVRRAGEAWNAENQKSRRLTALMSKLTENCLISNCILAQKNNGVKGVEAW